MFSRKTLANLPNNNRFYVLVEAVLASIFVVCLLRLQTADDTLYLGQLSQVFGFLAVGFLYVTLIISPLRLLTGEAEWMKNVLFARRGLGVAAAYFALLHVGVTFWGTLGGFESLGLLPAWYMWPLIEGLAALALLLGLTVLSFDKMVIRLGYPRWKQLQRVVYVAGVLVIVHMWTIGVHFGVGWVSASITAALVVLLSLEAWRLAGFWTGRCNWPEAVRRLLFVTLWLVSVALLGVVGLSRPAQAHMLLRDTIAGAGAVLHISPDDDPVAGEPTSFAYHIQAPEKDFIRATAELTVIDDRQVISSIPGKVEGTMAMADYTFPRQGLYKVTITLRQGEGKVHEFTQSIRVNRGVLYGSTVSSSTSLWAEIGLWGAVIAAAYVAVMAWIRRKAIRVYSKL